MGVLALCSDIYSRFLIFSDNVPPLVYYSHLPIIIISLLLAGFVLFQNRKALPNVILFFTLAAFIIWTLCDSIYWASNRSDVIMFTWSLDILFEPLVYIGALYLLYVLIKGTDLSFIQKLFLGIIYLPTVILVPTQYSLSGFDVGTCLSNETPLIVYLSYGTEILLTLWVLSLSVIEFIKSKNGESRQKIILLGTGVILFLIAFGWGNITGSFTDNWQLGQFGLFGMPIFAGFLVYSIVKFRTFNIKIIGTQALVVALWIALFALLFVGNIYYARIIISLTLILFLVMGALLIRGVLREVKQREQIAKMAEDIRKAYEIEKKAKEDIDRAYVTEKKAKEELEKLDKVKDQFLAQAQHDLRTPLTSIRGYLDLILNGTFGKQNKKTVEVIKKMEVVAQNMIRKINNFLDTSAIRLGKNPVTLKPGIELNPILDEIVTELEFKAKSKDIYMKMEKPNKVFMVNADREKLKAAIFNVVDNSIKFTTQGGVDIRLENHNTVKIIISDTGIGMSQENVKTLFTRMFERDEQAKQTASGSGIGLYLSTQIIKYHNGKIWAESAGEGKGSTFYIELPLDSSTNKGSENSTTQVH